MSSSSSRLYRTIADNLATAIRNKEYGAGDKLPGERELAEKFGVSRPTIREAMIALEIYGVVEIRHGVGNIVVDNTGRTGGVHGEMPPEDLDVGSFELLEARLVVEGGVAAIAAAGATDEDIALLQSLMVKMKTEDSVAAEAADREFHLAIARITKNDPLVDFVESLWDLRDRSTLSHVIEARARGGGRPERMTEHAAILDAIKRRDTAAARLAMQTHLEEVREYLLRATEAEELESLREKQRIAREALTRRSPF